MNDKKLGDGYSRYRALDFMQIYDTQIDKIGRIEGLGVVSFGENEGRMCLRVRYDGHLFYDDFINHKVKIIIPSLGVPSNEEDEEREIERELARVKEFLGEDFSKECVLKI